MSWLPLSVGTIPPDLRALGWVLWRAEPRGEDKPAKVPYLVSEPHRRASSTDPDTWASFDDAVESYGVLEGTIGDPSRGPVVGIGCVLTLKSAITCIDLDGVITDGKLDVRAETIVERTQTWTEISPSGRGLHLFLRGALSHALKAPQIEVYSTARFIAVTGHRWPGTSVDLASRQSYLDHLATIARNGNGTPHTYTGPSTPPPDDPAGALMARIVTWQCQPMGAPRRWADGFLVELATCPWAAEHTTGPGGAAVMIHASGAFDFTCLHAHCADRGWREFRARMEAPCR